MNALDLWAMLAGQRADGFIPIGFDGEVYWCDADRPTMFERKLRAWGWAGDLEVFPCRFREKEMSWPWIASVLWARVESPGGRDALDGFLPAPTLVMAAGAVRTALWALTGELTRRESEWLNRRLAFALGARLKDAAPWFSFSPPGTVLRAGRSKAVPVVVERFSGELHSARAVAGGLADPPDARAAWLARQA